MKKKNLITLKAKERTYLQQLIAKGIKKARTITRCRILLMADKRKTDTQIVEALSTARNTARIVRYRYVHNGLESAINEQPRPGAPNKFTGRDKAKVTALACSKPPEGHTRWTLRLIADSLVELDIVDNISHQTVKRILKKTNLALT
ncbi:MAG: helix-turn-helix domain-containing protein [Elusimicrobia bacterium]|nr:helix-turn-helix domain-containing protein [Elusimicrobiota bacterium]